MSDKKKHSVLVVDDEHANIMTLKHILGADHTIYVAKNGVDAIEIAEESSPDVILLDIIMPGIDGYETLAKLRDSLTTKELPVIFITGLTNSEDEEKGLELGASDYITKPFSPAIVKLRVRNQIKIIEQMRTIEQFGMTDQLTRLPNRYGFENRMKMEWGRAQREHAPISILLLDVDKFKNYNDTFGHQQGDLALQSFARALDTAVHRPADFAARWGGEEFIALLPNTNPEGSMVVAESIRKGVEEMDIPCIDKRAAKITVSIGAYTSTQGESEDINECITKADAALYYAKDQGRNRAYHFKDIKSSTITAE